MSNMVWKDFYQAGTDMFNDPTFEAGLVPLLFGIIPGYMLQCDGELDINLDKNALNLLKQKAVSQKIQVSPASIMIDDLDLLKNMLYQTENLESKQAIYTYLDKDAKFLAQ